MAIFFIEKKKSDSGRANISTRISFRARIIACDVVVDPTI